MPALLIVEDNAILATTLIGFLRKQGDFTVEAMAPSAEAALELLNHLVVDLVLVDVALPGINGIDLVAELQKLYPNLPCLMLSGHNEITYVGRALAADAKGYIVKSDPQTTVMSMLNLGDVLELVNDGFDDGALA